ncbi:MAG: PAS domain S-box protein [Anaerolineae bacterium]|nr:PAS domain S-box protein [Anaerolineae bacterium]
MLILVGSILLVVSILHAKQLRRAQAITMLIGVALPLSLNIAYIFELFDINAIDLNSIAFSISGVLFAWGMFGYRLFELAPMARETLIDRMQDGMLVIDLQNRIADINPAACAILGTPFSGVIGYIADEVLPPLDILNGSFKSWAILLNHEDWPKHSLEIVRVTRNTERNYEMEISTLYDYQNNIAGRLLIFHEITLQKKAVRATQSYARQLEQQNAELEASNAELDAFAHTVAHDLKMPLTTLIGFSTLLKKRWPRMPAERVTENLEVITQTGHKMTRIIEELLLLSSVRKQAETLDRFKHQIKESKATFSVPENWPTAIGYAPWIEEVWVNYISNALKYGGTPPGVELGVERQGAMVRFWVADNGPGLTPEAQAQLFTEFTRLDTVRAQGHGLGLSIVLRIITKLNGKVGVESEIGAGSKFWFTLRASEEVAVG